MDAHWTELSPLSRNMEQRRSEEYIDVRLYTRHLACLSPTMNRFTEQRVLPSNDAHHHQTQRLARTLSASLNPASSPSNASLPKPHKHAMLQVLNQYSSLLLQVSCPHTDRIEESKHLQRPSTSISTPITLNHHHHQPFPFVSSLEREIAG